MKIAGYIKEYTSGERVRFGQIITEVQELIAEIAKWNRAGMKEEFEDAIHFLQLWLFWKFKVNGEIWGITKHSVQKFMDRKKVWNRIYMAAGLPENISGFCGNWRKVEKVVKHLEKFGVDRSRAEEAYQRVSSRQNVVE